jgi:glucosamine-6-phosphate deaminase
MHKNILYRVFENPDSASAQVAAEIAQLIRERATLGRTVVLGLATGKSPLPLYQELVYLHHEEGLSFKNVITFNLDEYLKLDHGHPASFRTYMQENLFDHIDIQPKNIHFPSSKVADKEIVNHCYDYERKIKRTGGIDYQILGIGRTGHIGFNEPGTPISARTRRVPLTDITRQDAAPAFDGIENVPTHAITMGCGTILAARRIALLAWGSPKASIVRKALEGPVTPKITASYLQKHRSVQFYLDAGAASLLKQK